MNTQAVKDLLFNNGFPTYTLLKDTAQVENDRRLENVIALLSLTKREL